MSLQFSSLADVKLTSLNQIASNDAVLTVVQTDEEIPFLSKRCFFINASTTGATRGRHAHRSLSQFMICLSGEVEILVDDTKSKSVYKLSSQDVGLLVPPGVWCEQIYKEEGSLLMVLCDDKYDESDYIRKYEDYKSYIEQKKKIYNQEILRLNLGCGGRPLKDYINVDMDSLDQIRERYPNQVFDDDLIVVQQDLFNLPYFDNSVEEIRAEGLIEHLPFIDEPKFFNEIVRILKPGGTIYLSTIDFEKIVKQWLEADDNWIEFYRDDKEAIISQHWFGNYTYEPLNRWGYLTASIYGSQNGAGQFHTNCYSEEKLRAICKYMNLDVISIEHFQWKGNRDHMLGLTATKTIL